MLMLNNDIKRGAVVAAPPHQNESDFAMNNTVISRQLAISQDFKTYFTGKPCKRGHITERRTVNGTCVTCELDLKKSKGWYLDTKKKWEENNKEKNAADKNAWYLKNKHIYKKRLAENPESYRAASKKWRKSNPELWKLLQSQYNSERRFAKENNTDIHFTKDDAKFIYEKQKGKCVNCGKAAEHIDHIIPLAKGGDNSKYNIQWLCVKCNLSKGAKDPIVWAQKMGRLL